MPIYGCENENGRRMKENMNVVVVVCHDQVRLQVSQGFRCRDS